MKSSVEFVKRRPELLELEGWYEMPTYKFKFSCRYHDILRCSEFLDKPRHFMSCFRQEGTYSEQPLLRCLNPNWAIIYTPDKHGNFLGRCFVSWQENRVCGSGYLVINKVYGNLLDVKDVIMKLNIKSIECRLSRADTYLERRFA